MRAFLHHWAVVDLCERKGVAFALAIDAHPWGMGQNETRLGIGMCHASTLHPPMNRCSIHAIDQSLTAVLALRVNGIIPESVHWMSAQSVWCDLLQ